MKKILIFALACVLFAAPALALTTNSVSVSTTTGCTIIEADNYVLIDDGASDVYWTCANETVSTTNKAALKSTDGPITVYESCIKICYKTTSGTATLRIFSSP